MNPAALITGASRGLGRGIALALAQIGYDVVVNYAGNRAAAENTAAECVRLGAAAGHTVRAPLCQADISESAQRDRLMAFTRSEFGRLDLLVNNAGIGPAVRADLLEAGEESFDRLWRVNVKGPYFLTQQAARWMIAQVQSAPPAAAKERPKIVTVTSISAYTASVNRGEYCMAKAALAMLTRLYAARLAEYGILVYEVRPGIMATDMTAPVKERYDQLIAQGLTPLARWGTPQDVGQAVAAIAQGCFPFSTGEVINVDGGFHLRRL